MEQTLLPRLSVFVGWLRVALRPGRLQAAVERCVRWAGPRWIQETSRFQLPPPYSMIDVVQSLVENSLLRQQGGLLPEEPRVQDAGDGSRVRHGAPGDQR